MKMTNTLANCQVRKTKRLVLCNLSELYAAFKEAHPNVKIGFSKFCSLRPKWCVLAGASGTHSVCVCCIHQNALLLTDAIDWDFTYKDLMEKVVCDVDNRVCMMHRCESCPGSEALEEFLDNELKHLDMESEFHYCQWQTTDRAALVTLTTTYGEYKDLLIETINELTRHSYLAKAQAKYIKAKKDSLEKNEVIILGDFAENYQFLIQDEIQSFHTGAKNIVPYMPLLSITKTTREICSTTLSVSFLMITHMTLALFIKSKPWSSISSKRTFLA